MQGDVGIGSRIAWATGYNGTAQTTQFSTVKATTGNLEYLNFTNKPTYIVIATGNPLYNVKGLLNTSNVYQVTNVKLAGTGGTGFTGKPNLQDAWSTVGIVQNGTDESVADSHAVTSAVENTTIYSSTVNLLNKSVGYNLFELFAAKLTDYQVYVLQVNYTKGNVSGVNIQFTNYLENFGQNLFNWLDAGVGFAALIGFSIFIMAFPRRR